MWRTIRFDVTEDSTGESYERAFYLPYGTRTLRVAVTNRTGRARKLWLRPVNLPPDYPARTIYGYGGSYGDVDKDLLIHWAGGDETGACVKTGEKLPKIWVAAPVKVKVNETRPVFINVTHLSGGVQPRTLTLRAISVEAGEEREFNALRVRLGVPSAEGIEVKELVRGVWNHSGTRLNFEGTQLPSYVPRWWPPPRFDYRRDSELPRRLSVQMKNKTLTLKLKKDSDEKGDGCVELATVVDNNWEPGQNVRR